MDMQVKERRKLQRFDLEVPAKIEVMDSGQEKEIVNLLTSNICSGGAFFHTPEPLPEGTQIRLDLVLPLDKLRELKNDSKHAYIKVTGTVLRAESMGMAICFNEDYQIMPLSTAPLTQGSGGNHPFEDPTLKQTTSQN